MYTQCPECLTIYEIDEDALQASLGIVRCGRCDKRFDALRTLSDSLPEAPLEPLPECDPAERAPTLTEAVPPAAYESAARKRRPQRGTTTGDGQHVLDLAPSATADPANAGAPPTEPAGDDWFAQIESELTDSPAAPGGIEDAAWLPVAADAHEPVGDATGDTRNGAIGDAAALDTALPVDADARGGDPETLPDHVPASAPASETMAQEPTQDTHHTDAMSEAATLPTAMPALSVVSPWLLEGDVFGAQTHVLVQTTAVPDAIGPDTPATDAQDEIDTRTRAADAPDGIDTAASTMDAPVEIGADAPAQNPSGESEPGPAAPQTPMPVYVRPHHRRLVSASGLAWSAGCLLLALVLAAQLAWADRVELVRNPATRGWVQRVCANIPCRLPPIKDVAQLELLSRDVRPDPNTSGALTITATVRNNATFRQPWPVVAVELTDFDNHTVAMRRFRPAEYMPDPARRAAGIAPGATAALAFEVADPGKRAGGYRLGFE